MCVTRWGIDTRTRWGTPIIPDPSFHDRAQRGPLADGSTFTLIEDTAYFVFVGRLLIPRTPKHVEFVLTGAGAGAQTAEVGLFSTTGPPNKGALSLTKIVATGTVDTLVATLAPKRNTAAFATIVPAGTYLWAGIRTAMAGAEPQVVAVQNDFSEGYQLSTATAGVLTGTGPWTGAIIAGTTVAPALHVVYD